jgi:hypothetical protein
MCSDPLSSLMGYQLSMPTCSSLLLMHPTLYKDNLHVFWFNLCKWLSTFLVNCGKARVPMGNSMAVRFTHMVQHTYRNLTFHKANLHKLPTASCTHAQARAMIGHYNMHWVEGVRLFRSTYKPTL